MVVLFFYMYILALYKRKEIFVMYIHFNGSFVFFYMYILALCKRKEIFVMYIHFNGSFFFFLHVYFSIVQKNRDEELDKVCSPCVHVHGLE